MLYSELKLICVVLFFMNFYSLVHSNKNLIINLIFIELSFLALIILLGITAWLLIDIYSQLIIVYILTLTAIETAVGLAFFILYYKIFKSIDVEEFYNLKI